jgi:phosphoribosylformylglycinamidine synthase
LAVAIAECCFSSLGRTFIGANVKLEADGLSADALLFGETPSRIVISFAATDLDKVREIVGNCPFAEIGKIGGDEIYISVDNACVVRSLVSDLESLWCNSLEGWLYPSK